LARTSTNSTYKLKKLVHIKEIRREHWTIKKLSCLGRNGTLGDNHCDKGRRKGKSEVKIGKTGISSSDGRDRKEVTLDKNNPSIPQGKAEKLRFLPVGRDHAQK